MRRIAYLRLAAGFTLTVLLGLTAYFMQHSPTQVPVQGVLIPSCESYFPTFADIQLNGSELQCINECAGNPRWATYCNTGYTPPTCKLTSYSDVDRKFMLDAHPGREDWNESEGYISFFVCDANVSPFKYQYEQYLPNSHNNVYQAWYGGDHEENLACPEKAFHRSCAQQNGTVYTFSPDGFPCEDNDDCYHGDSLNSRPYKSYCRTPDIDPMMEEGGGGMASITGKICVAELENCGNSVVGQGEECDGGARCKDDCTCPFGTEPNGSNGCQCELNFSNSFTCCESLDDNGDGVLDDPDEIRLSRSLGSSCGQAGAACIWCEGDKGDTCNVGYFYSCADCEDPNTDSDPNNDDPDWEPDPGCTCVRPGNPNCTAYECTEPYAGDCDRQCNSPDKTDCYVTLDGKRIKRGEYVGKLYCDMGIDDPDDPDDDEGVCSGLGGGSGGTSGGTNGGTLGVDIGGIGIGGALGGDGSDTGGGSSTNSSTNSVNSKSSTSSQSSVSSRSSVSSLSSVSSKSSTSSLSSGSSKSSTVSLGSNSSTSSVGSNSSLFSDFSFSFSSVALSSGSSQSSFSLVSFSFSSGLSSSTSTGSSVSSANTHTECISNACVLVLSPGDNECETDNDCLVVSSASSVSSLSSLTSLSSFVSLSSNSSASSGARCGDGIVQSELNEECDDGNTKSGDGCAANCTVEFPSSRSSRSSASSSSSTVIAASFCGDGVVDSGEECDDGSANGVPGSGAGCSCDPNLPTCALPGLVWQGCRWPECGDGRVNNEILYEGKLTNFDLIHEQCDDGNLLSGDGCNTLCQRETSSSSVNSFSNTTSASSQLSLRLSVASSSFGNDDDDGDGDNDDGIPDNDDDNGRSSSSRRLVAAAAVCGNGILENREECDDSNRRDNDGCSSACLLEIGICGDGIVQTLLGEQCEQSTHDSSLIYSCVRCRFVSVSCGDGTLDAGEECDEGAQNSTSPDARCRPDCSLARCGDGILDSAELCDDGNRRNGDGCDRYCVIETEDPIEPTKTPTQVASDQTNIPFSVQQPNSYPYGFQFPNQPNVQTIPYQLPFAQLQPLIQGQAPAGDTGPAAVAVIGAGAAAGFSWMRRKKK